MGFYAKFYFLTALVLNLYFHTALKLGDVRNHLGTRTPYRYKLNINDTKIQFPHCRDTRIWMIARHGTRLPSSKDIIGRNTTLSDLKNIILSQHKLGKGELNRNQLKQFERWSGGGLDPDEEKFLTEEGKSEMTSLADRMQNRFLNAINKNYDKHVFMFRYTATQRAQQSARYFTYGLFDRKEKVEFFSPLRIDTILRFYKHCDKWQKQVKKNHDTFREQKKFGKSKEMKQTLKTITKRLGLNETISLGKVKLMYKICGYETSMTQNNASPWCNAFDENTIQVLEYYFDLKQYWQDGYGYDLTYEQACLPIQHMFESFTNTSGPRATFMFAHSGTLLKILAYLQLYKPTSHLRGDKLEVDRPWRVTEIDCFAANLAFVLFECGEGNDKYLLTLHQERIIKLPMCKEELCPLDQLLKYFHKSMQSCVFEDICGLDENDRSDEL